MKQWIPIYTVLIVSVLLLLVIMLLPGLPFDGGSVAFAAPVALTETGIPTIPTIPSTSTFTPTATATAATATSGIITPVITTPPPTPKPVSIPEPITVVLFGTGLAALSAAAASRRKGQD